MNKKLNLLKVTLCWVLIVVCIGFISGVIANNNAAGGEQKLFIYWVYSIIIAVGGAILINIFAPVFFYKSKNKKMIYAGSIVLIVIVFFLLIKTKLWMQYDTIERNWVDGMDKFHSKIEYYPSLNNAKKVRSINYWKNNQKDSVWSTFSETGILLQRRIYRQDLLVESTIK